MSVIHNQHPHTITLPPVAPGGSTYSISAAGPLPSALGTSGQVLTSTGINYANTVASASSTWSNTLAWGKSGPANMSVSGDAEIQGKLKVGGMDIVEMMGKLEINLAKIEERLAILHVNEELEDKWKDLKALGEQYRELEKYIMEKEKTWEILNR